MSFFSIFFACSVALVLFVTSIYLIKFSLLCCVKFYNALKKEEYYDTSEEAIKNISIYIHKNNLQNSLFYDIGSSGGNVLFSLQKLCPGLRCVGIERDGFRIFCARFRNSISYKRRGRPKFLKKDFFRMDCSGANIVFVYLPRIYLERLSQKLDKELRPGTFVITYRIDFPYWVPEKVLLTDMRKGTSDNSIFIYKKGELGFVHKK